MRMGRSPSRQPARGHRGFVYQDTDAEGDASLPATVTLDVKLATTIYWTNPAAIVYGTILSRTQLDATASIPGTLTYAPPLGTLLKAGVSQPLTVTFTPDDSSGLRGRHGHGSDQHPESDHGYHVGRIQGRSFMARRWAQGGLMPSPACQALSPIDRLRAPFCRWVQARF